MVIQPVPGSKGPGPKSMVFRGIAWRFLQPEPGDWGPGPKSAADRGITEWFFSQILEIVGLVQSQWHLGELPESFFSQNQADMGLDQSHETDGAIAWTVLHPGPQENKSPLVSPLRLPLPFCLWWGAGKAWSTEPWQCQYNDWQELTTLFACGLYLDSFLDHGWRVCRSNVTLGITLLNLTFAICLGFLIMFHKISSSFLYRLYKYS